MENKNSELDLELHLEIQPKEENKDSLDFDLGLEPQSEEQQKESINEKWEKLYKMAEEPIVLTFEDKIKKLEHIFEKLKKDYEEYNKDYINILKKMKKDDIFIIGVIDNRLRSDSIIKAKIETAKKICEYNNIPCIKHKNFFILNFRDFPVEFDLVAKNGIDRSYSPLITYIAIKKVSDKPLDFYEHVKEIRQFMKTKKNPKNGVNYKFKLFKNL